MSLNIVIQVPYDRLWTYINTMVQQTLNFARLVHRGWGYYYNNKRKPQSEIAGTQSVGVMVSGAHNLEDSSQVVNNYWW